MVDSNKDVVYLADEPFYTYQGEGPFTGLPSLFIRFWGCNFHCSWCFPGDTRITMFDGSLKPISAVKEGQKVISFDKLTGSYIEDTVITTMSRIEEKNLYRFDLVSVVSQQQNNIESTEDHEFLTHTGWKQAKDIKQGDRITGIDGAWAVANVSKTHGRQVFNFETEKTHTYIAEGVVVHNCDTKYSWETKTDREPYEYTALLDYIDKYPGALLVLTGGEPVLQTATILRLLEDRPERMFQLETNGSLPIQKLKDKAKEKNVNLVFIASPKLQSTGNTHVYKKEIVAQYDTTDAYFKFVFDGSDQNKAEIVNFISQMNIKSPMYLMPEGRTPEEVIQHLQDAWEWGLTKGFRLTCRIHTLAFGNIRSV